MNETKYHLIDTETNKVIDTAEGNQGLINLREKADKLEVELGRVIYKIVPVNDAVENKQDIQITIFEKNGWKFSNWVNTKDENNNDIQIAVMVKHPRKGVTHYAEIDENGDFTL